MYRYAKKTAKLNNFCLGVTCGDPTPAIRDQFGEVIDYQPGPYFVGHTFRFRCLTGHNLLGSSERMCLSNGRWSGQTTVCDPIGKCILFTLAITGKGVGRKFSRGGGQRKKKRKLAKNIEKEHF